MILKEGGVIAIVACFLLVAGAVITYGLEGWKVKEVVNQGEIKQATLINIQGEELIVKEGDPLPDGSGEVAKIKARSIVIKEPVPDGTGSIYYEITVPPGGPGSVRVD